MSKADKNPKGSDIKELSKYLAAAGDAAVSLTVLILLGVYGGKWLDDHFHTAPWWTLGLSVTGMCLGLWRIIAKTLKMD
jgi:F0F1-type ATP synthase assembly protein I